MTAPAAAMKAASQRPPAWIASSTSGASTAAERMRVISKGTGVLQRFRRRRSEEHTSELQSLMRISYAVFCLKKKKHKNQVKYTNLQHSPTPTLLRTTTKTH